MAAGLLVRISHTFAVPFKESPQPLSDSWEVLANISLPSHHSMTLLPFLADLGKRASCGEML